MTPEPKYNPVAINNRIETEEVLGPLPDNWEKAPWGKTTRHFFVDHNTKTTTWVDPRTYHLRKHDIRDIVAGELPYAWEETFHERCGIYYIDHITQAHFLDAPWEDHVRDEVLKKQEELKKDNKQLDDIIENSKIKNAEMVELETKMLDLELDRERLEKEVQFLEEQETQPDNIENIESIRQAKGRVLQDLQELNEKIVINKAELALLLAEYARMEHDIKEFEIRLKELRLINEKMDREANEYLMEEKAANKDDLNEMRNLIEMESAQRAALEQYIKQLKMEVMQLYNPEEAEAQRIKEEHEEANADEIIVDKPLPESGTMDVKDEEKILRKRLEEEKEERERLKALTENLEGERLKLHEESTAKGFYALPDWIKELNVINNAYLPSGTVRIKISKKPTDTVNPDELNFKEKMALFEANAKLDEESNPEPGFSIEVEMQPSEEQVREVPHEESDVPVAEKAPIAEEVPIAELEPEVNAAVVEAVAHMNEILREQGQEEVKLEDIKVEVTQSQKAPASSSYPVESPMSGEHRFYEKND